MRTLGVLLLIGSLLACGRVAGSGPEPGLDGGPETGATSEDVDSGFNHRRPGSDASCEPAFVEAGTGRSGDAEIPVYHRAAPACCPSERGPAPSTQPYTSGMAAGCTSDSQCTSGADGRCFPFEGLVGPGGCSYDGCFTDSDCPSGTPCLCRISASDTSANMCVPGGNCVVDSDCGSGGYCSPSPQCYGVAGYYCHTAADSCINDTDCPAVDAGGDCQIPSTCAYSADAQRWACSEQHCCPP
jgi:hypothetical protein